MDASSDELQTLLGDGLFEKLAAAGEANGYAAMAGAGTGAVLARLTGSTASSSIQLTGSDATNYPTVRSYSLIFTKLNGTVSRGQSIIYNETLPVILMMNTSAYAISSMSPEQVKTTFSARFDELLSAAGSGWPLIMGGASSGTEKRPVLYRMQRIGSGTSRSIQLDATDTEAYPTVYAATVFVNNEGGTFSNSGTNIREL